jgi:tetratricopeptide (TPR) repeat protein
MANLGRRLSVLASCLLLAPVAAGAGTGKATVREYRQVIRTYPFSDPDPIPTLGRIYPYFRFDGYADRAVDREWTVIDLENDYLRISIMPEIGGKIWRAVEKSTGRSFIYDNHVVKFRDIAMRGPWTSGGIEANYGIIGHTPNCATPVDYLTRVDPDGTAVVVIGVLDLLTRTPWRLEVALPPDKAYFTTRSFWYNATPLEQPYYSWMNAGIKAAGNLQLIYPGTVYLGHGGEVAAWPTNGANGKDMSFYEQNDFGPYKSYHVFGRYAEFFGAYWHDDDFGMGRYSRRDDKLGKKAWIWGLSRQGMIWETLLSDHDGQYVEVQSGRLFNQAAETSTLTPFKHRGFDPYAADTWTEYWFPVKGTRGFVQANDLGALNVRAGAGTLELRFSPLQEVREAIEVLDGDRVVYTERLDLKPLQTWAKTIPVTVPAERLRVRIGGPRLEYRAPGGEALSRPVETPRDFDWGSVFGLWLKGQEWVRQREYALGTASYEACLRRDPNYLPALVALAFERYRAIEYQAAWDLARRALAIDTYDPAANYAYGLASECLGRVADALDGFEVAASSPAYRVAAWNRLARLHLRQGDARSGEEYAGRATRLAPLDLEGYQVLSVAARFRGDTAAVAAAADRILALDPLSHFVHAERYLLGGDDASRRALVSGIRNEMPHETLMELGVWYYGLGRLDDARRILELAAPNAEALYWVAFIRGRQQDPGVREALRVAEVASPRFVFPFRAESAEVLDWALREGGGWTARYYRALLAWSRGDLARARDLLAGCGQAPDYAPFYAARAQAFAGVAPDRALSDLLRASELDPREWRYGRLLVERYFADRAFDRALETARRYREVAPEGGVMGLLYAKALLLDGRFADAAAALDALSLLPLEGSTEGRVLYREAHVMLAVAAAKAGRADVALGHVAAARQWPEHLGAGKPYPEDTDERLEDWLEAQCLNRAGRAAEAREVLEHLASAPGGDGRVGVLLTALAAQALGRAADAERALSAWCAGQADARVVAWGRRVFAGEPTEWPADVPATEEHRAVDAWMGR